MKAFNISLPQELLDIIDEQAKFNYANRSEYIRGAVLARLSAERALNTQEKYTPESFAAARKVHFKRQFLSRTKQEYTDDIY